MAFALLFPLQAAGREQVTMVRVGAHDTFTRFVMDLSKPTPYKYFFLDNPHRLVVDLKNASAASTAKRKRPERNNLITTIRYGIQNGTDLRIVLDLSGKAQIKEMFLIEPRDGNGYRLVLDIMADTQPLPVAEAPKPSVKEEMAAPLPPAMLEKPPLPAGNAPPGKAAFEEGPVLFSVLPEERPTPVELPRETTAASASSPLPVQKPAPPARPESFKPLIVLDPGHGGQDPGATGKSGKHEKYLTLDYAATLGKALEATGKYRVLLTRYDDTFIRLDGRVAIARKADADLFVSLHADAHHKPGLRGLSVYTLSETASDREAAVLATKHNKSDILPGMALEAQSDEIAHILIDFAHRDTANNSASLAETLVANLKQEVRLLNNAHRFAGFRVLTAPDIPSVLIELGYLSNPDEERLLQTGAYKKKLVNAVIRAIDTYFTEQKFFDAGVYATHTP